METLGMGGLLIMMGGFAIVLAIAGCIGDFIYKRINK